MGGDPGVGECLTATDFLSVEAAPESPKIVQFELQSASSYLICCPMYVGCLTIIEFMQSRGRGAAKRLE